jgi:hypothetical protein
MAEKVYRESATTYHLNPTETFRLPIQPPAEAAIQHLNIFVYKVMPSWRGTQRFRELHAITDFNVQATLSPNQRSCAQRDASKTPTMHRCTT